MKKVYIASPYTKGDQAVNVKAQIDAFERLMGLGYCPFAPLLTHFQHMIYPRPYEDWIEWSGQWVTVCDALIRLPGESSGADAEVELAKAHNIPVFYSVRELHLNYGL